jgi:perosamine synthetase
MSGKFWRIGTKEIEYIQKAIESGLHNEWNKILEEKFAERFHCKFAIGVNSGTSALHCALYAAGVREGDEVIVPPLTFGAPAFAALYLGAVPVFADIDPHTFTIDPMDIERKISKRTKAIIPVSLYGLPSDIDAIMAIAEKHDLTVIEDNAQCVLGKYNSQIAGSVAHMSIFSFQRSKHITCESGGMVVTNNEKLAESTRKFSILGYGTLRAKMGQALVTKEQVQRPYFLRHELVAPNYRLPEVCAAIMVAQLEKVEMFVEKRKKIAELYADAANDCEWLIPQKVPEGFIHSYWTYAARLDTDVSGVDWEKFRKVYLANGGEPYYAAWALTYIEPPFVGLSYPDHNVNYEKGICPVAEKVQPQMIQLKTNFSNMRYAEKQAKILGKTIRYFKN